MRMLRVYTAAKLSDAQILRDLCAAHPFIYFHARWLKHMAIGTPESPERAKNFWVEDQEDIAHADYVIVYGGDTATPLRGALVEAGMAIAFGKTVLCIGDHPSFGTWQYHPQIVRCKTVRAAMDFLAERAGEAFDYAGV